jgi:hypothetical protein
MARKLHVLSGRSSETPKAGIAGRKSSGRADEEAVAQNHNECDEVEMLVTTPERRSLTRFPLLLSVKIQIAGTDAVVFAETKNISAGGVYMYTHSQLELGSELELSLGLPPELTQSASMIDIACRAKVLRIDTDIEGRTGIAAEIYSYDFLANAAGVSK